jgi:tRNA pseudouridine55 synthase
MFGVLNIDKPLHCTSHDVVAQVRKIMGLKKVGHAGTLDPLASGVLPVCIGDATRLIEYFPSHKRYRARICLGQTTPTWDAEGERISIDPALANTLTSQDLQEALQAFQGDIQQTVPPHAAVHVNGKKLYEYARKGIEVPLPVRTATIHEMRFLELECTGELPSLSVEIHCASGTYIRSIAMALGQKLGTGAYLSQLCRTHHGVFSLENAVSLDALRQSSDPKRYLIDPSPYLAMSLVNLTEMGCEQLSHGMKLFAEVAYEGEPLKNHKYYGLQYQGVLLGIALGEEKGRLKPVKVFSQQLLH